MEKANQKETQRNDENALSYPLAVLLRVKIGDSSGNGSGFFVRKDLIATNIHVIAAATSVKVELINTKTRSIIKEFNVIGVTNFDANNDLAILKIEGEGMAFPIGNSAAMKSGDFVEVIGFPNGIYESFEGYVHNIRSCNNRILMKAKVKEGMSGGPVLNRNSKIIGISVGGDDSYSFAIPSDTLKTLLTKSQIIESFSKWQERELILPYNYLIHGKINIGKSAYDVAINDLNKAIDLFPNNAFFYHLRSTAKSKYGGTKIEKGFVADAQKYYKDAIDDLTKAIELCPDYAQAYTMRGIEKSYFGQSIFKKGNSLEVQQYYKDAINDHTYAIKLWPDFASAYNNRADALYHYGKFENEVGNSESSESLYHKAIIDINTAIELSCNFALFYHTRGEIKLALGDLIGAISDFEKASEIDPNYTDILPDLELAKKALRQQEETLNL